MALILGQATVPASTTGTLLFMVPPSLCNVTFWNIGTQTVYLGTGTAATLGGTTPVGVQCHSIPTSFSTYVGSRGVSIYGATAGTASTFATTLQYIISTDF